MKTETISARAYIRVSRVGDRDLISDEVQVEQARSHAQREGWSFEGYEKDLDVSGFKGSWRKRPGLAKLFEDAKAGKFQRLVAYKLDRLARNVREALDLFQAFEDVGVTVVVVVERIDDTPAGRLQRNILLSVAEMESENISRRVRDAKAHRRNQGRFHGGALPVWLRYTDDKHIELDTVNAPAIREMVRLRVAGKGYAKIARTLNEQGFSFSHGAVYKYLSPTYLESMRGTGFWNRTVPDVMGETVRMEGTYPSLLTEEEYAEIVAVQESLRAKPLPGAFEGNRWTGHRVHASSSFLLSGLVFCDQCGGKVMGMVRSQQEVATKGAEAQYYLCPHKRVRARQHREDVPNKVQASALEDAVLRVLKHWLAFPPPPEAQPSKPVVRKSGRTPQQVQKEIDRLVELYSKGLIEEADWEPKYNRLVAEREKIQTEATNDHGLRVALGRSDASDREELRALLMLLVERVETPVVTEEKVRYDAKGLRRWVRVVMKYPDADGNRVFLSGIYATRFRGDREVKVEG